MKNIYIGLMLSMLLVGQVNGQNKTLTAEDYQRASNALWRNASPLIDHDIRPQWLPDGRLWYRALDANGAMYKLYDPKKKEEITASSKKELFEKAAVEEEKNNTNYWKETPSPDGKYVVFIRDWNLWLKEVATGEERALTTDGVEDFGYATHNAGWIHSDKPVVSWSPDSKKIATYQQDQRHLNDMYLVKTKVGAPELQAWKYPLPEDSVIIKIHRVIIDISADQPQLIRLNMEADDRRSSLSDDVLQGGKFADVAWSKDSKRLAFVSNSRDHKKANLRIANCETGEVREVFEEVVETQFESGQDEISWRYLSDSQEVIWYSERSDWGHLYLYDAESGKLKNPITEGDFVVRKIIKIDEQKRKIYFTAGGKEKGINPYYRYLYRVDFSGKNLKLLTPNLGDHVIRLAPTGDYFVDSYSQTAVPAVHELRTMDGKLVTTLEKTDISRLEATGWKAPTPFSVKSADEQWDLYGLLFTPSTMDASKKYPVIVYIYPGPQGGSVSSWGFRPAHGDSQALAELGFVVIRLEGSCNPQRSKSFHDACYGNMAENTLPDHIAALEQLAKKHTFMDLEKVGIWGHSGGGFATAAAMFKYPDFFKVGISESGNHDNRNYEDDWGERYIGLETYDESGVSNYEDQANQTHAKNLKGKLLLIHGAMDDNVPPYNVYLVIDALISANKDFDFILLPHARHGFGKDYYYIMRKRWDYFVTHLMEATPPAQYKIKMKQDPRLSKKQ